MLVMLAGTVWVDHRVRKAGLLRTTEATTARLLLSLPLVIALARFGYHLEDSADHALFGLLLSGCVFVVTQVYVRTGIIKECLFGIASCVGAVAYIAWVDPYLNAVPMLLILSTAFIAMSALSKLAWAYRGMSTLILFFALQGMVFDGQLLQLFTAMGIGAAMIVLGYQRKWREPVLGGLIIAGQALFVLAGQAIELIHFGSWIGLALAGVALVVLASVVERYGINVVRHTTGVWHAFKAW